jgi:hypothetical protein
MKKPTRQFGEWGRSAWTGHLELTIIWLTGVLALGLMARYF